MRGCFDDLTGQRFGRLAVVGRAPNDSHGRTKWKCVCDCGEITTPMAYHLKRGTTQSCGCLSREISIAKNTKHGKSSSKLYSVWADMKDRCENKNNPAFENYGGRGVAVCDEWREFKPFLEWALANGYEESAERGKCTLDREDNDGNYEPSNCRWITMKAQGNNRRNNHMVTYNGETNTLAQWAELLGMSASTLYTRVSRGWDLNDAFTRPVKRRGGGVNIVNP